MFVLKFGLTFEVMLRYRFILVLNECPPQVHLSVRFVLKFQFMIMSKFGFVLLLGLSLSSIHVLALISVQVTFMLCSDLYSCGIRAEVPIRIRIGLMFPLG